MEKTNKIIKQGNIIYCCKTREASVAFLKKCDQLGIKWEGNDTRAADPNCFRFFDNAVIMEKLCANASDSGIAICYQIEGGKVLTYCNYQYFVDISDTDPGGPFTFVEFVDEDSSNTRIDEIFDFFNYHNKNLTDIQINLLNELRNLV